MAKGSLTPGVEDLGSHLHREPYANAMQKVSSTERAGPTGRGRGGDYTYVYKDCLRPLHALRLSPRRIKEK